MKSAMWSKRKKKEAKPCWEKPKEGNSPCSKVDVTFATSLNGLGIVRPRVS